MVRQSFNNGVKMKKILFLCFAIIASAVLAQDQEAELRLYENDVMSQRFIGVVIPQGDNYIFIHRSSPPPTPTTKKYTLWRLIELTQDSQDSSIYYLGNSIPVTEHCIVPFVNGVMCPEFTYNSERNLIQFTTNGEPDVIPASYSVSALILLNP